MKQLLLILLLFCYQIAIGQSFTPQEVDIWKQRIKSTEFSEESARIIKNANAFLVNTEAEIWKHNLSKIVETKPETTAAQGAVKPERQGIKLRDAAFLSLLGETKYNDQIKATLLKQIREPSVNFANRSMWPLDIGTQAPMFHVAEWVTVLLKTYEYSKPLFTTNEQKEIETWFHNAGKFFYDNTEAQLDILFVDRKNENYNLSGYGKAIHNNNLNRMITHVGGRKISVIAGWRYQNRHSSQVRTVAEVGMLVGDSQLKNVAKKYVKEWVRFSVFPDGLTSEFERGSLNYPEAGFYYNNLNLEIILQIADLFARNGDTSLYDYETSLGFPDPLLKDYNPSGGPKSIWLAVQTSCKLKNKEFFYAGSNKLYAYSKSGKDGKADYFLIDGFEYNSWFYKSPLVYVQEGNFAQYNIYFKDSYVKNTYLKSRNTNIKISGAGPHHVDQGSWGTTASKKLMYWDMEGKVNPYSDAQPETPPVIETPDCIPDTVYVDKVVYRDSIIYKQPKIIFNYPNQTFEHTLE